MQADTFLRLKVVLQTKPCKVQFGGSVQTPANISDTKLHMSTCRGHYNLIQRVFAYNSHTVCGTFKNLVSADSLNGAESLCHGHAHFR